MANSTIEWKQIPGFEDYEISNEGVIRRIAIMATTNKRGFLRTSLRDKDGKRHDVTIHILVAKLFLPIPEEKVFLARHKDGDRKNNHASNIYWVTKKIRDCVHHAYRKRNQSSPPPATPDYSEHNV